MLHNRCRSFSLEDMCRMCDKLLGIKTSDRPSSARCVTQRRKAHLASTAGCTKCSVHLKLVDAWRFKVLDRGQRGLVEHLVFTLRVCLASSTVPNRFLIFKSPGDPRNGSLLKGGVLRQESKQVDASGLRVVPAA